MIPQVQSAGGLVIAAVDGDLLGLFVSHQHGVDLQIPKGMLELGESLEMAALREVEEESGCSASLLSLLGVGEWDYEYQGSPFREVCHFFMMTAADLNLGPHDTEFECVEWIPLRDAPQRMRYDLERELINKAVAVLGTDHETAIAQGHGLWGESASGRASWGNTLSGSNGGPEHRSLILFRDELHPRDANQLQYASGVVAERGGPASHLAVVAAGMRIPSLSGVKFSVIDGLCRLESGAVLREGSVLRVDGRTGTLWAKFGGDTASVLVRSDFIVEQGFTERLVRICEELRMPWSGNYKFFKRDLAARFFPTVQSVRLGSGWTVEDGLSSWRHLGERSVRISVFPEDIACHATSVLLSSDESESRAQLQELDRGSPCEMFVQQSPDQLAFRCVYAEHRIQIEGGLGQAMYIFEAERGSWSTSECELSLTGHPLEFVLGDDASTSSALSRFIQYHAEELVVIMTKLAAQLDAAYLAVEGYFNLTTNGWVVVDLDLPEDRFLMGD